jgi:CubicO group peptidase (beta-lactamase class C family)
MFQTGILADVAKQTPDRVLATILSAPLAAPPGEKYVYTNAPSVLLGMIAERVCNATLDVIAGDMFFRPLEMKRTTFHAEGMPTDEVAPTALTPEGEIRGLVHDPSARAIYRAGRMPGHAGLFSTAPDLLRFAEMLLAGGEYSGSRFFAEKTIEAMYENQLTSVEPMVPVTSMPSVAPVTPMASIGANASFGWSIGAPAVMGTTGSAKMFGKTGFTGTMFLVDPAKNMALVILSNRTYPQTPESYEPMRAFWRRMADLVFGE